MKITKLPFQVLPVIVVLSCCVSCSSWKEISADYPIQAVPFTQVQIADAFWSPREETNRKVTVWHDFKQSESTGRLDNFSKAARLMEGKFEGLRFNDSDVYKIIEGAAYTLAVHPDPKLDKYLDDLIVKIAAAQQADGYLYTALTVDPKNPPKGVKPERWVSERESHETYCAGHLYEAAVAHFQATGKRSLLNVAIKNADLMVSVFGADKRRVPNGHQEIEIGLAKLYRVTGDEKYLNLAGFFLDVRGRTEGRESYGEYFQDHRPVLEQTEAVGHVVRAAYMYSAIADVGALSGDSKYVEVLEKLWSNVAAKKLYITGGVGGGNSEGFSAEYNLPNMRAYSETCASIANAFWNQRMFLLQGDAKYVDLLERVIYNAFLSGIGMTGNLFFYPNRLASFEGVDRSPWFNCSCCPSNVVRFIPQIAGYIYARKQDELFVNLYIAGSAALSMNGRNVRISQETNYPWQGQVRLRFETEAPSQFTVKLRIPGWARNVPVDSSLYRYLNASEEAVVLKVNGEAVGTDIARGYVSIRRSWKAGDEIILDLPMPVRRVLTDPNVVENRGRVALERGPLVYCAEWPDNAGSVLNLVVPDEARFTAEMRKELLGGVVVLKGKTKALQYADARSWIDRDHELVAVPYYAWAHRGPGPMAVWLAREPAAAWPRPAPTIAYRSRISASQTAAAGISLSALNDQVLPRSSSDMEVPRFTWRNQKGTVEWAQYEFEKPARVSAAEVFWFDNEAAQGPMRIPQSWRLLYRAGNVWKPVLPAGEYGVQKDLINSIRFEPVQTDGLRLEATLQPGFSGGILEWCVK